MKNKILLILSAVLIIAGCSARDHSNPFDLLNTSRPEAMSDISANDNLLEITSSTATISWTRSTDDDFFSYRILVADNDLVLGLADNGQVETIDDLFENITDELYQYFAAYEVIYNSGVDEVELYDLDPFTYYYVLVLTENKAGYISTTNILEFRTQPDTAYSFEFIDPLASQDVTKVHTMVPLTVMSSLGDPEQILLAGYYGSPSLYGGAGSHGIQNMLKMAYPFVHGTYGLMIEFDNLALNRVAYEGTPSITEITFPAPGTYPASGTAGYFLIYDGLDPYCVYFQSDLDTTTEPDLWDIDEALNYMEYVEYIRIDTTGMTTGAQVAAAFAVELNDWYLWYVDVSGNTATVYNTSIDPTGTAGQNMAGTASEGHTTPDFDSIFNETQPNPGFPDSTAEEGDYYQNSMAINVYGDYWDLAFSEDPWYSGPDVLKYPVDDIFSVTNETDDESYIYFTDTFLGVVMGFTKNAGELLDVYASSVNGIEEPFDNFYIPYLAADDQYNDVTDGKYGDIVMTDMTTPEGSFIPFSAFRVLSYFDGSTVVDTLFGATKEGGIYRFGQDSPAPGVPPAFTAAVDDQILDMNTLYEENEIYGDNDNPKFNEELTGWTDWDDIAAFDYHYDPDTGIAHVFVLEKNNGRILTVRVSDTDAYVIDVLGSPGDDYGEFNGPSDMLIYQENIFVADTLNHRVQIFKFDDSDESEDMFKFISSIGSFGYGDSQFVHPKKIEIFNFDASGGVNPELYIMVTDDKKTRYFLIDELF